jgi:3-methyladenine DNA glycosylase Mpg
MSWKKVTFTVTLRRDAMYRESGYIYLYRQSMYGENINLLAAGIRTTTTTLSS